MPRLGSENRFPLVRLVPDDPPATPPAGQVHVFVDDADNRVYSIDDTGLISGPFGPGAGGAFDPDIHLPWHVPVIPMAATPDATTGTWVILGPFNDTSALYPFATSNVANVGSSLFYNSTEAPNDAVAYDVILAAGTWDMHAWVRKSSNAGIITLQQDGVSMGTVDTYAAAGAAAKVSITGWTVAATGKKRMNLKAATKNASSTAYRLYLVAIEFRRTA